MQSLCASLLFLVALAGQDVDDLLKQARDAYKKDMVEQAFKALEKAIESAPKDSRPHLLRAQILEAFDKYQRAVQSYSKAIDLDSQLAEAYQGRGSAHFKLGKIKASIDDFDKYIELRPKRKVSHWQRGISYYYAGRYDDGSKQFEGYQTFDSNDVENAVWRFMCMVRSDGIKKARKAMLKIKGDTRIPMKQIYDLYLGKLKPDDVFEAAKAGKPSKDQLNRHLFYAHLYVGIYHDLLGNKKQALTHLQQATEKHRIGHYMWDVARVHRDLLKKDAEQE